MVSARYPPHVSSVGIDTLGALAHGARRWSRRKRPYGHAEATNPTIGRCGYRPVLLLRNPRHVTDRRINPVRIASIIPAGTRTYLAIVVDKGRLTGPRMENKTMKKTMMIAAALLTFGASSAFAGEDFYDRFPATTHAAPTVQQANGQRQQVNADHLLFPTSTRQVTSVYAIFATPGSTQGGSN